MGNILHPTPIISSKINTLPMDNMEELVLLFKSSHNNSNTLPKVTNNTLHQIPSNTLLKITNSTLSSSSQSMNKRKVILIINSSIEPKNPFLEDDANQLEFVGFNERKGFVVKVYGLLSLQLFVTFLFCVIAYASPGFRNSLIDPYSYNGTPFFWVCFVVSFITEIAIFCCKKVARKSP